MSTTFAKINGRKEMPPKAPHIQDRGSVFNKTDLYLTRFLGEKDLMLQISIRDEHIQLTKFQVRTLLEKLQLWETAKEIDLEHEL